MVTAKGPVMGLHPDDIIEPDSPDQSSSPASQVNATKDWV
jgi:hypothetical protein